MQKVTSTVYLTCTKSLVNNICRTMYEYFLVYTYKHIFLYLVKRNPMANVRTSSFNPIIYLTIWKNVVFKYFQLWRGKEQNAAVRLLVELWSLIYNIWIIFFRKTQKTHMYHSFWLPVSVHVYTFGWIMSVQNECILDILNRSILLQYISSSYNNWHIHGHPFGYWFLSITMQ